MVIMAKEVGTAPALPRRGSRTYSDLGREEPTMREEMRARLVNYADGNRRDGAEPS